MTEKEELNSIKTKLKGHSSVVKKRQAAINKEIGLKMADKFKKINERNSMS
jgi:hypothetical protein